MNAPADNNQSQQGRATGTAFDSYGEVIPSLAEKLPFEVRANPLIDGKHQDFLRIKEYFASLLQRTTLTLQEILDGTFEPHEILLFEPATFPPELVELQRYNIIRYQRILESRFTDHHPSLQLKLAFLYFGLPVAPMKPGIADVNLPLDLDFGAHEIFIKKDPFEFLDEYAERTYGDASIRSTSPYLPRIRPTQELPSMKLRGGAEPNEMEWEYAEDEEDEEDEEEIAPRHSANRVRIWGFQGSVLTKPSNSLWLSFIEAVDHLLGVKYDLDYMVWLDIWKGSELDKPVSRTKGMIRHGRLKSPEDDPIYSLVQEWSNDATLAESINCFVYFDKEAPPPFYQPPWSLSRYVVRLWDQDSENMAYMKVPEHLELTHQPNQYLVEYLRAMRVLYPGALHQYLEFAAQPGLLTYGLFDPPHAVWKQVTADQAKNDQLPFDHVAIWVPGWHMYNTDFWALNSPKHEGKFLLWDDLKSKEDDDGSVGLSKVLDTVAATNPVSASSEHRIGIDVWIPGEKYLDIDNKPNRVSIMNNKISPKTLLDWRHILLGFQGPRYHAKPSALSIVARPVFNDYQFHLKGSEDREFSMDINREDATLSVFKALVKSTLYPEYSGDQEDQVLHLAQRTWAKNEVEFAIRADTSEQEWELIVRRITEPGITVSLENWTNGWTVQKETVWGPRYNLTNIDKLSSQYESTWKPGPFDVPMNQFFSKSGNNRDSAYRAEKLREKFFWDIPSVFINPAKPGIPIHGTPVETIIKTGPNVPGFTTAMRTPSEVARLEREVHTLRGNLLEKIRECPYMDCERYFPFQDGEGLARHMREDHAVLQCFLCEKSTLLFLHDSGSMRQHFLDEHYDDLKELFGIPAGRQPSSTGPAYCNRCGRDEVKLKNPKDQVHHNRVCNVGKPSATRYCIFCGREGDTMTCICDQRKERSFDAGDFCEVCGLEYDSTMDRLYREHHRRHCRQPGGSPNDFCPKCGIILVDISEADKSRHVSLCSSPTQHNPSISSSERGAPGYSDPTIFKQRDPTPKITDDLGQLIDTINQEYLSQKHRKSKEEYLPAEHSLVLWRQATSLDEKPNRRSQSPSWDEHLGEEPEHFSPAPDWRCSRCFRAAGNDVNEIEMHMDQNRSCKIRRGLGTTKIGEMPNHSGWIQPEEGFDFSKAYFDFVRTYPAYKYTMFPVRDENVAEVWSKPFDPTTAVGSIEDDPNFRGPLFVQTRSGDLPWPPYEGTIIPLSGSKPSSPIDTGSNSGGDQPAKRRTGAFVSQATRPNTSRSGISSTRPSTAGTTSYRSTTIGADSTRPTTSGSSSYYRTSSMPPTSAGSRVTFASEPSSVPPSSARSYSTFSTQASGPSTGQSARPSTSYSYSSRPSTEWSTQPSESRDIAEEEGSEAPSKRSRTRAQARGAELSEQPRRRSNRRRRGQQ
ncbi:hypothetical protein F5Y06DRAFT_291104 [Hypoxylon sp. FL0890]|nr:hypothetical protein F5Y06DRAFT_291104 [Hypoxylon sp. FL0890]